MFFMLNNSQGQNDILYVQDKFLMCTLWHDRIKNAGIDVIECSFQSNNKQQKLFFYFYKIIMKNIVFCGIARRNEVYM